jgi:endoglycosylceramidase
MTVPRFSGTRKLAALAATLLLAACGSSSPPDGTAGGAAEVAATDSGAALHHDGAFMVDEYNRVVLLHGVNAVWKLKPYYIPGNAAGFTAADADFLAANGFNVVRLGVLFAGVMPQKGVIDRNYLDQVDRVVQLLASRHIRVLLDFHQDMYNEQFQGEGFPDWAVPASSLPDDAKYGFPLNEFISLALNNVYDRWWANSDGLWAPYQAAWTSVAARWRDQPYLLGYDLFNEPWPGTQWPTCFEVDCPLFDASLQKFMDYALAGVRASDTRHFAFFEPQQLFDFGAPSAMTAESDPALGLSWHDYCSATLTAGSGLPELPDCGIIEPRTMSNADAQIAALGATSLMTEFGATDDTTDIGRVAALADQHLVGWTYWAYKGFGDPTGGSVEGLFTNDADLSTLKPAKADVLIRPYARAIAGTPQAMSFDGASKQFNLSYTPRAATAPTEIFVPARHYPKGYRVTLQGGQVTSAANAAVLTVANDAGAAQVQLTVQPAP